jgi:hypothetical protein
MHANTYRGYTSRASPHVPGASAGVRDGWQKRPFLRDRWLTGLCFLLVAASLRQARAQTRPDPFASEVVAVRAKHIETVSKGVMNDGIILIRNGKITAVGTDVKIPVGARVLRADTVMPGIVGAYSQIGLSAVAAPAAPAGFGGGGGGAARSVANPHFKVRDELYPFDENYARLLRSGVTTLALAPGGRGIAGQGVVVRPQAESAEKMPVVPDSPLTINFAPNTQTIQLIRNTFEDALPQPDEDPNGFGSELPPGEEPTGKDDPDPTQGRRRPRPQGGRGPVGNNPATGTPEQRREPVTRALQGIIPTYITCSDPASVLYLLPLLQPYTTLKLVYVVSGAETYKVAEPLGQKKASVILLAELTMEPLTTNRINIPAILAKAGAKVALRPPTDSPEGYQLLRYQVGELIKMGLDRDTALKSITLTPAEMLGIASRVGSIETGRDANLILLDGDPFLTTSRIRTVLLEGKTAYEE